MFAYDFASMKNGNLDQVYAHPVIDQKINLKDFKSDLTYYKSKDGTEIPLFIVRKKSVLPTLKDKPK